MTTDEAVSANWRADEDEEPDLSTGLTAKEVIVSFESMFKGLRTAEAGITVSLLLTPNDPAVSVLLEGGVNSVWYCSLLRLGEHSHEPDPTPSQLEGARAVRRAVMLAKDPEFQRYCQELGYVPEVTAPDEIEQKTTEFLRGWLGIASRAQLRVDAGARSRLNDTTDKFYRWRDGVPATLPEEDPFHL